MQAIHDRFVLSLDISPGVQLRTLRQIFARVKRGAQDGFKPIVEIDLDLAAIMPLHRTRSALKSAGQASGVDLFLHPEDLDVLPGYTDEAWLQFVRSHDLIKTAPNVSWLDGHAPSRKEGSPFSVFHASYWTTELLQEDTPTPGLGAFVHRIEELGGAVVFVSGRWLREHIEPTCSVLRSAGISDPKLVIGNDRHPTLVPKEQALSDAEVKILHQERIVREFGQPVAIVDDRATNRGGVIGRLGPGVLGIGIAIPGFSYDPATASEPLRLSTFETFDATLDDVPRHSYLIGVYGNNGAGAPWQGLYEGLGRNNLPYILPRIQSYAHRPSAPVPAPFAHLISEHQEGSLPERELVRLCGSTIPEEELAKIDACLEQAERLADQEMASPFPRDDELECLRLSLVASCLHARDIELVMRALGYPIVAAGVHDLVEMVAAQEIRTRIEQRADRYSPWVVKWARSLSADAQVNVSCLNPALATGMWRWTPQATMQDAMDVHRLAAHHEGDGAERYDPIEAAVNNVLHQREGTLGIRKEEAVGWMRMLRSVALETEAADLAKSLVGRQIVRDAIETARTLERSGALTPWGLSTGQSFDD